MLMTCDFRLLLVVSHSQQRHSGQVRSDTGLPFRGPARYTSLSAFPQLFPNHHHLTQPWLSAYSTSTNRCESSPPFSVYAHDIGLRQMAFYGAYHSNKINILVHILFVPILMWTGVSMGSHIPTPEWLQVYPGLIAAALNGGTVPGWFFHHRFNEYMVWDLNVASVIMVLYWVYYFILEPVGTVRALLNYVHRDVPLSHAMGRLSMQLLYAPQIALSTLTAVSYASSGKDSLTRSTALHIVSWIAQFLSHGIAEGRAPALLDNLLGGTFVLPFSPFPHISLADSVLTLVDSSRSRPVLRPPRNSLLTRVQASHAQASSE